MPFNVFVLVILDLDNDLVPSRITIRTPLQSSPPPPQEDTQRKLFPDLMRLHLISPPGSP